MTPSSAIAISLHSLITLLLLVSTKTIASTTIIFYNRPLLSTTKPPFSAASVWLTRTRYSSHSRCVLAPYCTLSRASETFPGHLAAQLRPQRLTLYIQTGHPLFFSKQSCVPTLCPRHTHWIFGSPCQFWVWTFELHLRSRQVIFKVSRTISKLIFVCALRALRALLS